MSLTTKPLAPAQGGGDVLVGVVGGQDEGAGGGVVVGDVAGGVHASKLDGLDTKLDKVLALLTATPE